ncbi:MAG TPA: hypothetical protein VGG24_04315 [Paraburkholderia sp.]|jgi:hypothetical protein
MNTRTTVRLSLAVLVSLGALGAGMANAQQPAASPDMASPAATTTHPDAIVQKRSEVRAANRKRREQTSQARSQAREQSRQARNERNQSVQASRQRAASAIAASPVQ